MSIAGAGQGNGMKKMVQGAVLAAVLLSLAGCAALNQMVQTPQVTFDGLKIRDASLTAGTFNFNFIVNNPNPVGIRASRITYAMKLNGLDFVSGKLDQGLSLPSRGAGQMTIPVRIAYLDVFDSMMEMMRRKTAAYDISGRFYIGPVAVPFQTRGTFDLPRMPRISLESIRVEQLSLLGARLRCRLNLDNQNAFALVMQRLDYNLKLGETSFARASANPAPVGANARSGMDLVFNVSFAQLGRTAYQLLQGGSTDYTLEGKFITDGNGKGGKLLPFKLGGKVPLIR